VESIVNSRPLITISCNSEDPEALTPNHILTGKGTIVYVDSTPFQRAENKWEKVVPDFAVGDVVLLQDENAPRCEWPLGVMISTETDQQGLARTVELRSKGKILRHPVHHLVLLLNAV
jgi:hypothetical protein